jgi:biotin carboxylase
LTLVAPDLLEGKRLLLLGGTPLMCHVVRKARELGVHTIVTDYYDEHRAPAKVEAEEAYAVSTLNVPGLIDLARAVRADGVFTGYSDITLLPCRAVCDALGFPFYASRSQLEQTLNKRRFKALCRKHGVPVVPDIDPVQLREQPQQARYPVIIKPADSYSSRGISVCANPAEVAPAIERALSYSSSGEFVAEPYIEADDVYLYLTVQDGILSLSAMADRLMNNEQPGLAPQPAGYLFPSRYIDNWFASLVQPMSSLVADLGLRDGTFFVQGFVLDGTVTLFEMGLRLSGGAGYLPIAHENGIDQVKMHVAYALTGQFSGWDLRIADNPRFQRPHCVLVVLLRNGIIGRIEGWEQVCAHSAVYATLRLHDEGDVLTEAGTLNQVFARIYLCAGDQQRLLVAIAQVRALLSITDVEGASMMMGSFMLDAVPLSSDLQQLSPTGRTLP